MTARITAALPTFTTFLSYVAVFGVGCIAGYWLCAHDDRDEPLDPRHLKEDAPR